MRILHEVKSASVVSIAFGPKGGTFAYTLYDGRVVMSYVPTF